LLTPAVLRRTASPAVFRFPSERRDHQQTGQDSQITD